MTRRIEYDITKHPAQEFTHLVVFCSESAQCSIDRVPHEQTEILKKLLNERGNEGWEAIQMAFGQDGLVVFWKRLLS